VLDISAAGLRYAQRRLGPQAKRVRWLVADVLTWRPQRRYQVWHDRAVFHFLTASRDRLRYLYTLDSATAAGAVVVVGCFALDGPQHCSGLPVARYGPRELAAELGGGWTLAAGDREEHFTPPASPSRSPGQHSSGSPAGITKSPRCGPGHHPSVPRRRTTSTELAQSDGPGLRGGAMWPSGICAGLQRGRGLACRWCWITPSWVSMEYMLRPPSTLWPDRFRCGPMSTASTLMALPVAGMP
jgi:hypothetical protein